MPDNSHMLVKSLPHVYHLPESGAFYISPTPSFGVRITSWAVSDPSPKPHPTTACVLVPLLVLSQVDFSGYRNQHICKTGAGAGAEWA